MGASRTATDVHEVIVPGVDSNAGHHGIKATPQHGQTAMSRACKVVQTTSLGDAAHSLAVRARRDDHGTALQSTDFQSLDLQ